MCFSYRAYYFWLVLFFYRGISSTPELLEPVLRPRTALYCENNNNNSSNNNDNNNNNNNDNYIVSIVHRCAGSRVDDVLVLYTTGTTYIHTYYLWRREKSEEKQHSERRPTLLIKDHGILCIQNDHDGICHINIPTGCMTIVATYTCYWLACAPTSQAEEGLLLLLYCTDGPDPSKSSSRLT